MELELFLAWAVIATIISVLSIVALIKIKKRLTNQINELELGIEVRLKQRGKEALQLGINTTTGDYSELLGDFALLTKYDQVMTLSTTAKNASLDLIGVNEESLDFIEIKKKKPNGKLNTLSDDEKNIRRLVEEKKVSYKVFDVELPTGVNVEERKLRPRKKIKENS